MIKSYYNTKFWGMVFLCVAVFISGCAHHPVIKPSPRELIAVKPLKKTVAIVEFGDKDSSITELRTVALGILEKSLIGHFNLVEREKIQKVWAERNFSSLNEVERFSELGKMLGADYLIFGNAIISVIGPELKYYQNNDDKFYGKIWEELCGISKVFIKMVDVSSGMVVYTDNKMSKSCRKIGETKFNDEGLFKEALRRKSVGYEIRRVVGAFSRIDKEFSTTIVKSLENATEKFRVEFRREFPQTGEVLQILSAKNVVVNLGSAYGIRPGDKLMVWKEVSVISDPKTGLKTTARERGALLKVIKVTSGLSCIARGKKREISGLKLGDVVATY